MKHFIIATGLVLGASVALANVRHHVPRRLPNQVICQTTFGTAQQARAICRAHGHSWQRIEGHGVVGYRCGC